MKPLAVLLAALALAAGLAAASTAQTAAPPGATAAPRPWRPVIIVDPRPYLASPTPTPRPKANRRGTPPPHARRRPLPVMRRPLGTPTPETFERLDTSPSPHAT